MVVGTEEPALSGTAAAIADCAAELFARKGFSSTSIREIVEAASITKPMLYYYFGNKDGLIRHILETAMDVFASSLNEVKNERDLQSTLLHITEQQLKFAEDHPAIVALMARIDVAPVTEVADFDLEAVRLKNHLAMRALFATAVEQGEIANHDPTLLTLNYFGALIVHIMVRIQRPELFPASPRQAATQLVNLFLCGARREGEKMMETS